jgi:CBS domain-containing protein
MICPVCSHDNVPGAEVCERCLQDLTCLDLPIAQDRVQRSLMHDPIGVLHPQEPITIRDSASLREAIATMIEGNIGAVLVLDATDKLVGILSERDLLLKVVGKPEVDNNRSVRDFMTHNPEGVTAHDNLAFVLHKMDSGGFRHLPVLEGGTVVGVISVRDMLRHFTVLCKGSLSSRND